MSFFIEYPPYDGSGFMGYSPMLLAPRLPIIETGLFTEAYIIKSCKAGLTQNIRIAPICKKNKGGQRGRG